MAFRESLYLLGVSLLHESFQENRRLVLDRYTHGRLSIPVWVHLSRGWLKPLVLSLHLTRGKLRKKITRVLMLGVLYRARYIELGKKDTVAPAQVRGISEEREFVLS